MEQYLLSYNDLSKTFTFTNEKKLIDWIIEKSIRFKNANDILDLSLVEINELINFYLNENSLIHKDFSIDISTETEPIDLVLDNYDDEVEDTSPFSQIVDAPIYYEVTFPLDDVDKENEYQCFLVNNDDEYTKETIPKKMCTIGCLIEVEDEDALMVVKHNGFYEIMLMFGSCPYNIGIYEHTSFGKYTTVVDLLDKVIRDFSYVVIYPSHEEYIRYIDEILYGDDEEKDE